MLAEVRLHAHDGLRQREAIGQPLLADQGRAHIGDRADPVVVLEVGRIHQLDPVAVLVERPHVEQWQVRIAAATSAQHPGADRQRLDVVD